MIDLRHGDCLVVMRAMPGNSVDSIVTDPPYGLGFMGKAWDHQVPGVPFWLEMLRVAKPGAYLAAFGGTRTFHRMACAIEDAGWELRDTLMWVYGSGFPKSHNGEWGGTALKPAWEPIILARKPLVGTVEANWREHGTGALNIDGCRIGSTVETWPASRSYCPGKYDMGVERVEATQQTGEAPPGRWPANLIHDGSEEVVGLFPQSKSGGYPAEGLQRTHGATYGKPNKTPPQRFTASDGSAARFFYCAKASRADRNDGCEGMEARLAGVMNMRNDAHAKANGQTFAPKQNHHPTVKPTDLMRWLCRLVTPPGGVVLDPFMGSGSTGKAATLEGFRFIGIEREAEYVEIARARIAALEVMAA